MKNFCARFFLIAVVALLAGCASSPYHFTRVMSVNQHVEKLPNPPYHEPVVALLVDSPARGTIENAVVAALRAHGINARAALPIYGKAGVAGKSRQYIAQQLEKQGFDSAISIRLLQKNVQDVEVDSAPNGATPSVAGPTLKPGPLGPSFSLNEQKYVSLIRVWDVKQEAFVWSATVLTRNPKGLQAGATQFAHALVHQLLKSHLFGSNSK